MEPPPKPIPAWEYNFFYFSLGTSDPTSPYESPLGADTGSQGALGYGLNISKTGSLLFEVRFTNVTNEYYFAGQGSLFSLLANFRLDFVDPDNPTVFYGIVGLGPTWLPDYYGTGGSFRFGLGLEFPLTLKTSLTLETDGLVTTLDEDYSPFNDYQNRILTQLFSVGLKFNLSNQAPNVAEKRKSPTTGYYFLKDGGGFSFAQVSFTDYYNRPFFNGFSPEEDTSLVGIEGFTGSLAGGIDFPDSFSLFASSEWFVNSYWFQEDWALMANAQFAFGDLDFLKPYAYMGLGMDFEGRALGPAAQLAVGNNIPLGDHLGLFVEAKIFTAYLFYSYPQNEQLDFHRSQWYIPVLAGVKYNL